MPGRNFKYLKLFFQAGAYEPKSVFGSKKGFSMLSRRLDNSFVYATKIPGPGTYNPEKLQKT
jgi:hypothetical protein